MIIRSFAIATAFLFTSAAFAQNTTTAGDLQIAPQVNTTGSILQSQARTPVIEEDSPTPITDKAVKPAGAAIDAASQRREREQYLNVATPRVPLGETRASGFDNIDEKVPTGANDNGYRPGSASGYYDNAVEESDRRGNRVSRTAPTIEPQPAAVDPIRPAVPNTVHNLPGDGPDFR